MLKKEYNTGRLQMLQSQPQMAPEVLAFLEKNRVFFKDVEPLREKLYFTENFQRRALLKDYKRALELQALRLWLKPAGKPESAIIGMAALSNIVFGAFKSAFVSYKLDSERMGQGLMTEALRHLIGIAFNDMGLHRLEANIMPSNTKSLALAERLGFANEGLARHYLNIDGVWHDHIHMVLLND